MSAFQNMMNSLFHRDSHNEVAKDMGYMDADQMFYYENMAEEIPPMTDREAEEMIEREEAINREAGVVEYLAPPPSEILVLMRQDSREVYTDSEDCPRDGDFEHTNWQDLVGVY